MRSAAYLTKSALKSLLRLGLSCPSCGGRPEKVIDRKYLVTTLRRCSGCRLLFRAPTTSAREYARIYQREYRSGITTTPPSSKGLENLQKTGFRGSGKDYGEWIELLFALGCRPGRRLLDFGCSWGYGSWQLSRAGFAVDGYELSRPRADYARRNLKVNIVDPFRLPDSSYDIFFSSHVIEHVPSVSDLLALAVRLLRPGGLFVAFTPNGDEARRRRDPAGYRRIWGYVHPQLIDADFLTGPGVPEPLLADSTPYSREEARDFSWAGKRLVKTDGSELFFAFRAEK